MNKQIAWTWERSDSKTVLKKHEWKLNSTLARTIADAFEFKATSGYMNIILDGIKYTGYWELNNN